MHLRLVGQCMWRTSKKPGCCEVAHCVPCRSGCGWSPAWEWWDEDGTPRPRMACAAPLTFSWMQWGLCTSSLCSIAPRLAGERGGVLPDFLAGQVY
jgi:hypothetical protein